MNLENIHNYYEKLVVEHLFQHQIQDEGQRDQDYLEDLACLALNRLPVHYVRHDVDTAFFLSDDAYQAMQREVADAVNAAVAYLKQRAEAI